MASDSVATWEGQCRGGDDYFNSRRFSFSNSTATWPTFSFSQFQNNQQMTSTAAGDLEQEEDVIAQLMQLCLSEQPLSDIHTSTSMDSSSGHANGGGDWQEEVYQRIKTIKETYLPELNQLYQKIVTKVQQLESLPQQPKSDQLEKLKILKTMLERNISFLQVSKTTTLPTPAPLQQQKSEISQLQSHENTMHMQGPLPSMQQNQKDMSSMPQTLAQAENNMSRMQLNSLSSQFSSSQVNAALNSLQQNPVSTSQQGNLNALSSQNVVNVLHPNDPLQANGIMLQHQQQQLRYQQLRQQQLQQQQQQMLQQQPYQLMQKQPISQTRNLLREQSSHMRLQWISQIIGVSNKFPEPGAQSGHSNGGDWRSQMQAGSRQRIVNKIMETLKRQVPFYGEEYLQRMATGYEETFYSSALSESDYMRTISLKMLTVERYSPPVLLPYLGASPYSTAAQLCHSNGGDWKEEVYQKIKTMKETYLPELNQMLQEIVTKLQQPMSDQAGKLKTLKTMLERLVSVLQVSKTNILAENKQWLGLYEWRIIHLLAIKPDLLTKSQILQQIKPFLAIQPDLATSYSQILSAFSHAHTLSNNVLNQSAPKFPDYLLKRGREQELEEEVKKQKVEIQKLKQTLVQMQQPTDACADAAASPAQTDACADASCSSNRLLCRCEHAAQTDSC